MNYYNAWSWLLLYATLVVWLPTAKLCGLLDWNWLLVFVPIWGFWLLAGLGLSLLWCYRQLRDFHPAKGGVL